MNKFQTEIKKLFAVRKFLSDNEINAILHDLAVKHAKQTGVTYSRSCLILVNMLNTFKQGQAVADSYTE